MAVFPNLFRRRSDRNNLSKSSVLQESKKTASTSVDIAIRPKEEEFTYLKESGNFYDIDNPQDLSNLREKIRRYSIYNDTLSTVITLTSMFVSMGPTIVCEDEENQTKLQSLFESMNFETFLQDFVREYLISGEVTSFATWDDDAKRFTEEQILNPDQIEIQPSVFKDDDHIIIGVPEAIQNVFEDEDNPEHAAAVDNLRDVYNGYKSGKGFRVDSDKIIRVVNKARPWDLYGIPIFAPALSALVQEESLDAALFEQLTTLITPTIIGTVGLKAGELGQGQPAWIPNQEELDSIKESYRQMMMAKFRLGLFNIGVDFKNAFASAQVPNLDRDYARCEQKILRCVAAGKGLLDGSSGGPFASNAINRDVYGSVIQAIRQKISNQYQKRIDTAIRKMNIFAYRSDKDGKRTKVTVNGKPVYETAFLDFDHGIMRNANDALKIALDLASAEVPISKQTLADISKSGLQVAEELRKIKDEKDVADQIGLEQVEPLDTKRSELTTDDEVKSPLDGRNFE